MITFRTAAIYIVTGAIVGALFGTLAGLYADLSLLSKVGEFLSYAILAITALNILILYYGLFNQDMAGKDKYRHLLLGCLLLGVISGGSVGYLHDPLNSLRIVWMATTGMLGANLGVLDGIILLAVNPSSKHSLKE